MFCVSCGTQNPTGAFCTSCGAALERVEPVGTFGTASSTKAGLQNKHKIMIGAGAALLLVLIIVFSGALKPNPLIGAVSACNLSEVEGVELSDGDKTLSVDTEGEEEYSGASYSDYLCVIEDLGTPTRITERMDHTSAMDGQLTDSADGLTYFWKYHPNSGVMLTVTID